MSKMRSPNYPAIGLPEALGATKRLWSQEKRTPVDLNTIASAWGYTSVSGRVRSKLGALRKFGLVEDTQTGTRISELGIRIVHGMPDTPDYIAAMREAALFPSLFRELYETHRDASDQAIKSYLIVKKGFADIGAREATKAFRETMDTTSQGSVDWNPSSEPSGNGEAMEIEQVQSSSTRTGPISQGAQAITSNQVEETMSFRWLIGSGVVAEVKLLGGTVKPSHIDMLVKQLELTKMALEMDKGPTQAD